mmetsp:Transcript_24479/g.97123  ORF Transcript_24479/g.97123 Transcript_24479/m.97123 type:complete len:387 (-) Transcript_24479:371-1531(-)
MLLGILLLCHSRAARPRARCATCGMSSQHRLRRVVRCSTRWRCRRGRPIRSAAPRTTTPSRAALELERRRATTWIPACRTRCRGVGAVSLRRASTEQGTTTLCSSSTCPRDRRRRPETSTRASGRCRRRAAPRWRDLSPACSCLGFSRPSSTSRTAPRRGCTCAGPSSSPGSRTFSSCRIRRISATIPTMPTLLSTSPRASRPKGRRPSRRRADSGFRWSRGGSTRNCRNGRDSTRATATCACPLGCAEAPPRPRATARRPKGHQPRRETRRPTAARASPSPTSSRRRRTRCRTCTTSRTSSEPPTTIRPQRRRRRTSSCSSASRPASRGTSPPSTACTGSTTTPRTSTGSTPCGATAIAPGRSRCTSTSPSNGRARPRATATRSR